MPKAMCRCLNDNTQLLMHCFWAFFHLQEYPAKPSLQCLQSADDLDKRTCFHFAHDPFSEAPSLPHAPSCTLPWTLYHYYRGTPMKPNSPPTLSPIISDGSNGPTSHPAVPPASGRSSGHSAAHISGSGSSSLQGTSTTVLPQVRACVWVYVCVFACAHVCLCVHRFVYACAC